MEIKITQDKLNQLEAIQNSMLLLNDCILVICNIKYEKREEWLRKTFRSDKLQTVIYLTNCEVIQYNFKGRYLGNHPEWIIKNLITDYNLLQLRSNWLEMLDQIKAFGYELTPIPNNDENNVRPVA